MGNFAVANRQRVLVVTPPVVSLQRVLTGTFLHRFIVFLGFVACTSKVQPVAQPQLEEPNEVASSKVQAASLIAEFDDAQKHLLSIWYDQVGSLRTDESFGDLVTRIGRLKLGQPYGRVVQPKSVEHLRIKLDAFQCVSFVESTLGLARCIWTGNATSECFLNEIQAIRYRHGIIDGYASRLHYFTDWIEDNTARGHLLPITGIGAKGTRLRFSYMTTHLKKYPGMQKQKGHQEIAKIESTLSGKSYNVVQRSHLQVAGADVLQKLYNGDLVAFVGSKPGLLISHVGFIDRGLDGTARVLHASSYHQKVVLTHADMAAYVLRKPQRKGVILLRPKAPDR